MTQNNQHNFDKKYADEQITRSQSTFRKTIKYFYLENILKYVVGPAIDFGCGAGQLLAKLPPHSLGLELNPHLIEHLKNRDFSVREYRPETDLYQLKDIEEGIYKNFILSHVLEHFDSPEEILSTLVPAIKRLGINRIIICVPGLKGYQSDKTHRTFIDLAYIKKLSVFSENGFHLRKHSYFPINSAAAGKYFIYNELNLIYESV